MYGMMFSAKIAMRWMPPPANMLNMPQNAAGLLLENLVPGGRIDAGQRDVGAEPIDEQRAEREPDALLQLLGLGEAPKLRLAASCSAAETIRRCSVPRRSRSGHPPI